jgi:hypothetical protein
MGTAPRAFVAVVVCIGFVVTTTQLNALKVEINALRMDIAALRAQAPIAAVAPAAPVPQQIQSIVALPSAAVHKTSGQTIPAIAQSKIGVAVPSRPLSTIVKPPPLGSSPSARCVGTWVGQLQFSERKVFSQNGEDGVIQKLLWEIKPRNKYYVEFGTEKGTEINTRWLREQFGWTGLLLDGSNVNPSINLHQAMIKEETIVQLLGSHRVPLDLGILSVDIDSYDFWVLQKILLGGYRPDMIITEVNSQLGSEQCLTLPPASVTGKPTIRPGTVNFGASVGAFAGLVKQFGYTTVYCESKGVNCFHVKTSMLTKEILQSCPLGRQAWKPARYVPSATGCSPSDGTPLYEVDCDTGSVKNRNVPAKCMPQFAVRFGRR